MYSIDVESASTSELVHALTTIATELAHRTPPEVPAAGMQIAERLAGAIDRQECALAGMIAVVDASGEMRRWGLPSAKAWLRTRLGMRDSRATERLTLARQRHRLTRVNQRWAAGELSYGYAATIADAIARLDDKDCAKAEAILLDTVEQGLSPGKVGALGRRIRDVIAERDGTEHPDQDSKRGYERSWITTTRSLDGGRHIKGWLNVEDAAIWDGTLAPLAKPAGTDDHCDLPERTAAALSSVLAGGHTATRVTVMMNLDTLTGGTTPARLPDGTPIPAEQARRIALNAGVSPLILGRGNIPLYLGHHKRFATLPQRRVLRTLYPTCAVQGCEVPGHLCEVDHVHGWALGCPTDIDHLALTCRWHNQFKNAKPHQIHIDKTPDGLYRYRTLPPPDALACHTPGSTAHNQTCTAPETHKTLRNGRSPVLRIRHPRIDPARAP